MAASTAYVFRKRFTVFVWPVLAFGAIFMDWNHTREWKLYGGKSALGDALVGRTATTTK